MASAFHAYLSSSVTDVTGDGTVYTVLWNAERFDVDSEFDTSTGKFIVSVAGIYRFSTAVRISGVQSTHNSFSLNISAGGVNYNLGMLDPYSCGEKASGNNAVNMGGSVLVSLAENDEVYVYITVTNGSKVIDVNGLAFSEFCGEFVQ